MRQHRQVDGRPIVIVEGTTDEQFLSDAFGDIWMFFPAAGRINALAAISDATRAGLQAIFCVVDRDFDDEVTTVEKSGLPIITYRNADLEAMISTEDTLGVILRSFGREGAAALDLDSCLAEIALLTRPISLLRRANFLYGWGLNFDGTEPADKIDQRTLQFNIVGYCRALAVASNNPPPLADLIEVASGQTSVSLPSCPYGAKYYFNGKDFAAVLGVFMRKKLGSLNKAQSDRKHVSAILRSSAAGRLRRDPWASILEANVGPAF